MKPVDTRPSARFAVVLALLLAAPPAAVAVYDGYLASPDRSGIVRLNAYANGSYVGRCSGAIVSSSRARNETWILTAAHCWYESSWRYQQRRLPEPYRAFVPGSGLALDDSRVWIHPDWSNDPDPTWFSEPDIALVRLSTALAVQDRYGRAIDEFKRPIYVGSEELIHDLEDKAGLGFVPRGAFCGYGGSSVLRCGEAENFEIDDHYVVVDGRQWIGETRRGSKVEPGDSGGPALVLNRRLGSAGTSSFPEQGVLVAVVSGPDVKNAWDFELDSYHTATMGKAGWLSSVTGSGTLRLVQSLQDEWQISRSGSGRWETLNRSSYPLTASVLRFADMTGDGRADVFRSSGGTWYLSRSGTESWSRLNQSNAPVHQLAVADFTGDGRADVFWADGRSWRLSDSGTGRWRTIDSSGVAMAELALGDFNGDGRADVFYGDGSQWRVSYSGTGRWTTVNRSSTRTRDLAFGNFVGDQGTDVFYGNGSEWLVSSRATGRWQRLNRSGTRVAELRFGDFNGNGRTDVLYTSGSRWRVSDDGVGAWRTLNNSSLRVHQLQLADFTGDGRADIIANAD